MQTTARRALSELIDQLCTPAEVAPEPAAVEAAVPPLVAVPDLPVQREEPPVPAEPVVRPAAVTVLPGGARSAILWRSRTA